MDVLIGLIFLGASLAVAFVLPVISFLRATQASQRADALARDVQSLRTELAALRATTPPAGTTSAATSEAEAAAQAKWVAQVRDLASAPHATAGIGSGPHPAESPPLVDVPPVAAGAPDDLSADALGQRRKPGAYVLEGADASRVGAYVPGGSEPAPAAVSAVPAILHVPSATSEPALPAAPAGADGQSHAAHGGLEERIGARWLLYAGIGALILGVSYFIKFAFDNGWVSEPLRVAIGLLAGAALVVAGQRFVARGLAFFGHTLSGGGLVVLYVAIYAALHVYALIGAATAFAGMVLVTLLATALADRHRLQVLGALAVLGGFLTPVLVGGGQDAQIVLFTYNAILLAGALALVVRHAWAAVAALAYVLALAMAGAWAATFYSPAAWLRTLLFLTLHLALVMVMLVVLRRRPQRSLFTLPVTWLLLTAPILYHGAALAILGRFHGRLLVYLLLATVGGLSACYHAGWRWARTVVLVLVALPLITWMQELQATRWYTAAIVTACAVYLLHLAGQWRDLSDDDPAAPVPLSEIVHTHVTGLYLPLALYVFFEPRFAWWNAPMLTLLAAWNAGIATLVRPRLPVLGWQFVALAATLAAVAISEWFDGPVVAIGWALEGAAVGHAALRARSAWLDRASLVLFVLSAIRLVDALVAPMPVGILPVLNTRALAAVVVIGAMAWLAARVKETPDHVGAAIARHALILGAHVLAIGWISAEIALVFGQRAYASTAAGLPAGAARAELAQQVALSVAWALYAVGLVAAGFRLAYAPARYLAIALFGLTIVKVVSKDIAELDRVYQMLSVLGVGALLVAASYLYQHMITSPSDK